MAHSIYEDDIENRCVQLLMDELHYDTHINCFHDTDNGNDRFGRKTAQETVSLRWLRASLKKLNPSVSDAVLAQAEAELTKSRQTMTHLAANQAIHTLLTKGIDLNTYNAKKEAQQVRVRFIDFETPANNHFAVVQQLTIKGKQTRRPDLLIYINGLPLIFIELKNLTEPTRQAYEKNVKDYRRDIATLFHHNLLLILSNGQETKVGSMTSEWEHFFNWEKANAETDHVVPEGQEDLPQVLRGLCRKDVIIDMLKNFVLYYLDRAKIVAKNHQYLGVNNAVRAFGDRDKRDGKLGVFWHTQGSGKSFSMVYFVQKIQNEFGKNFKFVIITDREDLEGQILDEFERTGIIPTQKSDKKDKDSPKDNGVRAKNSIDLKERLKGNDRFVFTMIQKFYTKTKGGIYPTLTESKDIIVIVDEAHRSQYNDLAQNMRRAMPEAQFIAFTGTPLLDATETTKQWFGDYVSRYDFSDSVADGSTVRLFHQNRVPQMELLNDRLNEEIADIFHNESLTEEQQEKLLREHATVETVIGDADRLKEIAKDIVKHFVSRGYLGKGMVISITKEVTVRMHDLVQQSWRTHKQDLMRQRTGLPEDSPLRAQIDRSLQFMGTTEMAVIISYSGDDEAEFQKKGLNLTPHIAKMTKVGKNFESIEDRFKEPNDPLRLVFVCAKWLTGFDAPTVSTLYLDKPMQNHTLMQTIARANRVAPALNSFGIKAKEGELDRTEKQCGFIIDYIDVFKEMERALAKYGKTTDKGDKEYPAETFSNLLGYLDAAITEGVKFLAENNLDIQQILDSTDTFDKIEQFKAFADVLLQTDELKKSYGVHQTAITAFYEACKPDINDEDRLQNGNHKGKYKRIKDAFEYLRKIIAGKVDKTGNYETAKYRSEILIDESIVSKGYTITPTQEIDLSGIDLDKLQEKFDRAPYKHLAIADMVAFLRDRLAQLLARNVTRIDLAERLQKIINDYNTKGSDVKAFFKALKEYTAKLRTEEVRASAEGLTEAELEIFDLLFQDKLTIAEKQKVKLAAKALYQKLKDNDTQRKIMVRDWHRNVQTQGKVKDMIGDVLDESLPSESYPEVVFNEKWEAVYGHVFKTATLGQQYWA
jgi:type I restriction enzyme, R subunit